VSAGIESITAFCFRSQSCRPKFQREEGLAFSIRPVSHPQSPRFPIPQGSVTLSPEKIATRSQSFILGSSNIEQVEASIV
jgi:hypothetical protein